MSDRTRRLARQLRTHFRSRGSTASHYAPISRILVEGGWPSDRSRYPMEQVVREVVQIYRDYLQLFGANPNSFANDMRAFLDRVPVRNERNPFEREQLRGNWTQKLLLAGISPFGDPLPPPPHLGFSGTREQMNRWREAFREYFRSEYLQSPQAGAAGGGGGTGGGPARSGQQGAGLAAQKIREVAMWLIEHWWDVQGGMSQVVTACGWRSEIQHPDLRASINILHWHEGSQRVGRQMGVTYFSRITQTLIGEFNRVHRDAANYQEVFYARCHPMWLAQAAARGLTAEQMIPNDREGVCARMTAWHNLQAQSRPVQGVPALQPGHRLPALSDTQRGWVSHFDELVGSWRVPPWGGHDCNDVADRCGCAAGGGAP